MKSDEMLDNWKKKHAPHYYTEKENEDAVQDALKARVAVYDGKKRIFLDSNYYPNGSVVNSEGSTYTKRSLGIWDKE